MPEKASASDRSADEGHHAAPRRGLSPYTNTLRLLAAMGLSLTFASCGSSNTSSTPAASKTSASGASASVSKAAIPTKAAPAQTKQEHLPINEKIEMNSPVFPPAGQLPAHFTCDGANTPPPLEWRGIPAGTAELALYLIKVAPVDKHLTFNWAVAGINPKLHRLQDGKLPAGAVAGLNSDGTASYNMCPPKGTNEEYVFVLFALPHAERPKPNFDAETQRLENIHHAKYVGFLVFTYPRH